MQRLFTALSLPKKIAQQLAALRPPAGDTVQLVEPAQMHITLHFIGQADINKVVPALEQVRATSFSLQIDGLGKFIQANGATILWAGVKKNANLIALYQKIATVTDGYSNATTEYIPHITLARCKKETPQNVSDEFLNRTPPIFQPFAITEFDLYSSSLYQGRSIYRRERRFLLEFPCATS